MANDFGPAITQRNNRILLFKIKKDKVPFILTGSQAIFALKDALATPDTDSHFIKRTVGYPGGPWPVGEIEFVSLPSPNGGDSVEWGLQVNIGPADVPIGLAPGSYYIQVDIVTVAGERFSPVKGYLQIEETGIQSL